MGKKSFEKIEAGLTEALAFAKRDGYIARARLAGFQAALPTQITTGGATYVAFTPAELSDFLEAALATVAAPNLTTPPAPAVAVPEWCVADIWANVFGGPYTPAIWRKHQAIRPENISQAVRVAQQRAPECADVIAALLFWLGVERNRTTALAAAPEPPNG